MADSPVVEVSDLIVRFDSDTLERLPVDRAAVLAAIPAGARRARRIIEEIPTVGGRLDDAAVDRLLVAAHLELQRLNEEFQTGTKVLELIAPMIDVLREAGRTTIRVVDVGCGIGYLTRWLAARGDLGEDVELIGYDFNPALIDTAREAAAAEGLRCSFQVGNALAGTVEADVVLSAGVLHHFRESTLDRFFSSHPPGTAAFFHFDIHRSYLAPLGAWIFHRARMRVPLARHDGVASARRAHSTSELIAAASRGADGFDVGVHAPPSSAFPVLRVVCPVVGIRRGYRAGFVARLGRAARRLEMA